MTLIAHRVMAAAALACAALAAPTAQATEYRLTDLGALKHDGMSRALALNERGEVVGAATRGALDYQFQPTLYDARGKAINLARRAGVKVLIGEATGINGSGKTVGWAHTSGHGPDRILPFVEKDGEMTLLTPPDMAYGGATGVNNKGDVIGTTVYNDASCRCGFLWRNGEWTPLLSPRAHYNAEPRAINDRGLVVGWADYVLGRHSLRKAVVWQDGKPQALPSLGGRWSEAWGVNRQGEVVGASALRDRYDRHAFVYRDGRLIDLDDHPGHISEARAINNRGQIVGWQQRDTLVYGGFVTENGRIKLLTDLLPADQRGVWRVDQAHAINDAGQIVGEALNPDLGRRAVLLTPAGD